MFSWLLRQPTYIGNVFVRIAQCFVVFFWAVAICGVLSLASQLDLLSFPSPFPQFPPLPSSFTTFGAWIAIGTYLLFAYSLIEVLFSIYSIHLARTLQTISIPVPTHHKEVKRLLIKALRETGPNLNQPSSSTCNVDDDCIASAGPPLAYDHPLAVELRAGFSMWFRCCRWEDIYYDNVLEWLAGVILEKDLEVIRKEDLDRSKDECMIDFLKEIIPIYENRAGAQFPKGYNLDLKNRTIRLAIDPINFQLRPLLLYGIFWTMNGAIKQLMKLKGFKIQKCGPKPNSLQYLIRVPKAWYDLPVEERPKPVVFIYGVGCGLIMYCAILRWLVRWSSSDNRPIMILIQPHIAMDIFSPGFLKPPGQLKMTKELKQAFESLSFDQTGIEILAHSNGTIVAGWIMKAFPNLVKRTCLMDPVCMLLWEPDICYNFVYAKPKTTYDALIRYGSGTELGIAWYINRHFNWTAATLWPDQIPNFKDPKKFLILLSGQDSIVNSKNVRRYLISHGLKDLIEYQEDHNDSNNDLNHDFENLNRDNNNDHHHHHHQNKFKKQKNIVQNMNEIDLNNPQGSILFDPNAFHGESFMPGTDYFKLVISWMEQKQKNNNNNLSN